MHRRLLNAHSHAADIHDRSGAPLLPTGLNAGFSLIVLIWTDSAYPGLKEWLSRTLGWQPTIGKHWRTGLRHIWGAPDQPLPEIPHDFHGPQRHWVVERTFAWSGRNRSMSRDYERLIQSSEMLLYAASARVMLRRERTNGRKLRNSL